MLKIKPSLRQFICRINASAWERTQRWGSLGVAERELMTLFLHASGVRSLPEICPRGPGLKPVREKKKKNYWGERSCSFWSLHDCFPDSTIARSTPHPRAEPLTKTWGFDKITLLVFSKFSFFSVAKVSFLGDVKKLRVSLSHTPTSLVLLTSSWSVYSAPSLSHPPPAPWTVYLWYFFSEDPTHL